MNWKKSNTGKLQYVIIHFVIVLAIYSLVILRFVNKEGGGYYESWISGWVFLSPFLIPALLIVPFWIIRKKIPKEIELNAQILQLTFSKKEAFSNDPNLFAYSFHRKPVYSVLTFYTKYVSSRGHYIYRKKTKIIAPEISISWKSKALLEIKNELDRLHIEERPANDKDNFIDHLIGQ
jgi:hypothetical protein